MGTDNLYHRRKRQLERKSETRSIRQRILIVCEGKKTEPNYFRMFPVTSADVKILGEGFNTKSLVRYAKELADQAKSDGSYYDQVWCVFDKDSFSKEQFNTAVQMAQKYDFKIAYSNEAFELWYVLHFEYLNSGITREQYIVKLTQHLKKPYKKNSLEMYELLFNYQDTAIKRAKKLMSTHAGFTPANSNPSTTVYKLVEELKVFIK